MNTDNQKSANFLANSKISDLANILVDVDWKLIGMFLQGEFDRRKERNPSYSLRAFARDLTIDPTDLSKAIRFKKALSVPTMNRIATQLKVQENVRRVLLMLAATGVEKLQNVADWQA